MSDIKSKVRSSVKIAVFIALFYIFSEVPKIFSLLAAIIGAFSIYEILNISNIITNEKWSVFFILYAVIFPFIDIKWYIATELTLLIGVIFLFVFLFVDVKNAEIGIVPEWVALLFALIIPAMLKSMPELAVMENGATYVRFGMMTAVITNVLSSVLEMILSNEKFSRKASRNKAFVRLALTTPVAMAAVILVEYFCSFVFDFEVNCIKLIALSLFTVIADQFGDLSASVVKRMGGCESYSDIIPGHGGILDKFCGMIFAVSVAYVSVSLGLDFVK